MKRPIIFCTLILVWSHLLPAQSALTHQKLFDTIPYIMDHHQNRLALFKKETKTKGGILFLGNSITEGGAWPELIKESPVVNRGIGGDITFGMLNRLDEVAERKADKLFLLIGINDLSKDIPAAVVADNVRKIIEELKAKSAGTRIFLQSILPLNPTIEGFPQHFGKQEQVLMCNQLLYKVAADTDVTFVNLFPYFLNNKQLMREDLSPDGVHLNRKGYEHWISLLHSWELLTKK